MPCSCQPLPTKSHFTCSPNNLTADDGAALWYGDGNRKSSQLQSSCMGFPPLVTLDVAAHEATHGITEHNNGLLYYYSFGGINEMMSGACDCVSCSAPTRLCACF